MKRILAFLLIAAMVLTITACGGKTEPTDPSQTTNESQSTEPADTAAGSETPDLPTMDPSGAEITVPETVNTIVVLAPAISETLVALGLGDKVIGYDLYSVGIAGLPENVPTFDTVNPDVEQLVALAPDVMLVSSLSLYDQEAPYQPLIDAGVCVICIPTSDSVEDVKIDISFLAAVFQVQKAGQAILDELNAGLEELAAIAATIPEAERKTVYFEISAAPYMYSTGSGTYLNEMIELVGGINVLAAQSDWLSVTGEAIVAANPDVIFTNVNYLDDPVAEIMGRDGWAGVTAITNKAVYCIDNMASSLPNQNILVALRQMAEAMYPEYFGA